MDTHSIRACIALARRHEEQHGHLFRLLQAHWPRVRGIIRLRQAEPCAQLHAFVLAYIGHAPDCLEAADAITREAHIDTYAAPLLNLAADFFPRPGPSEDEGGNEAPGLIELLNPAYLTHRLLEEVNDRFMFRAGIPLVPVDTTVASLIVHGLIGEPFANELDDAVQFSVEQLAPREAALLESPAFKAYAAAHRGDRWTAERSRWPCLSDQLGIEMALVS